MRQNNSQTTCVINAVVWEWLERWKFCMCICACGVLDYLGVHGWGCGCDRITGGGMKCEVVKFCSQQRSFCTACNIAQCSPATATN
jgi:hypothetical protein